MQKYYTVLQSKSHAFLLDRKLRDHGITCEITYMPRAIMTDLCNFGVRFNEYELCRALEVIRSSGLAGCRVYKEIIEPNGYMYEELKF